MNTTLCINRSGSCTERLILHRFTPKGLLSFCHCEFNFQIPESPARVTVAEWWGREKGCRGRGGAIGQAETWRNALSGSGSVLFVPPPCNAWKKNRKASRESGQLEKHSVMSWSRPNTPQLRPKWVFSSFQQRLQANPAGPNPSFKLSEKWLMTQLFCPHLFSWLNKARQNFQNSTRPWSPAPSGWREAGFHWCRLYADECIAPLMGRCQSLAAWEQLDIQSFGSSPHLLLVRQPWQRSSPRGYVNVPQSSAVEF